MAVSTAADGKIQKKNENPPARNVLDVLRSMEPQLKLALPSHMKPERMVRIALTAVRQNPDLGLCTPESFLGSVMTLAQLGLEPNTPMGHAYLIPFNRSVKTERGWEKRKECQVVIGYRGFMDLARRSGQVKRLYARPVYEGDEFRYTMGLHEDIVHIPNESPDRESKPLTHVYAVAVMENDVREFLVLTRGAIEQFRKRSNSQQYWDDKQKKKVPYEKPVEVWETDYTAMALKTVIRRLYTWLPVSSEIMARSVALDERADVGARQTVVYSESVVDALQTHGVAVDVADEDSPVAETVEASATQETQGEGAS